MAHLINRDDCVNCGACEEVCPVSCISEIEEKRVINQAECVDCGACKEVCPVNCITGPDEQ
ncbi:MAG: 4Fe-4S binding protein [Candidatus Cloacimonetes bacterium]|nr:4Fe-4S binding protein [Candidatus Cloacimonadota bacterium]